MVQKLASAKPALVEYQKHQGVTLTKEGKQAALEVIRHHRLLEAWLVQTLDYSWDEVHKEVVTFCAAFKDVTALPKGTQPMETQTVFRIILPILIIAFAAHRGYYVRKHGHEQNTLKKREEGWVSSIAGMLGLVGFIAVIAYLVKPNWLSWAALPLPLWLRWTGVGVALLGFVFLQWAQNTLGKNWSDTPRMIKEQALVTNGPYRFIRHPIYTAFLLILGSTLLISANGLIGLAWIGMTVLEVTSRIRFEEALMLEYFGDQYRDYMKRTGTLLPVPVYRLEEHTPYSTNQANKGKQNE